MFIVNSSIFIESFLIIYDKFPLDEVDLIYLISCLLLLLYYTINKIVIRETLKIFCKKEYEDKDNDLLGETEDKEWNKKNNSFSDEG